MADAVTRCAPFLPRDKEAGAKEAALQWNSNGWIQLNLSNQQIAKDCSGPKVTFKKNVPHVVLDISKERYPSAGMWKLLAINWIWVKGFKMI